MRTQQCSKEFRDGGGGGGRRRQQRQIYVESLGRAKGTGGYSSSAQVGRGFSREATEGRAYTMGCTCLRFMTAGEGEE